MTKTKDGIQLHRRSNVVTNNQPKQPTTDKINIGEIAINFAAGYETLWIKNSNNQVVGFSRESLPSVTSSDNGKILQVVNGAWALVTPTSVYTGTAAPDNNLGNNGDIYLQTS